MVAKRCGWTLPGRKCRNSVALTCKVEMERGTRLELATVCLEGVVA